MNIMNIQPTEENIESSVFKTLLKTRTPMPLFQKWRMYISIPKHIWGNVSLRIKSKSLDITFKECRELTTTSICSLSCRRISAQIPYSSQVTGMAALQPLLYPLQTFYSESFRVSLPSTSAFEYLIKFRWNWCLFAKNTWQGLLSTLHYIRSGGVCAGLPLQWCCCWPVDSRSDSQVPPL